MTVYTTRDVADMLGTETWRVRRLYEDGTLPEPGRLAGKRVITRDMLAGITDALRRRGWLDTKREGVTHAT